MALPPKIDIDGVHAAWLLPWGKRLLAAAKRSLPFGVRRFVLDSGEKVTIWWGYSRDRIKLEAAVLFGVITALATGPTRRFKGFVDESEHVTYKWTTTLPQLGTDSPGSWNKGRNVAITNSEVSPVIVTSNDSLDNFNPSGDGGAVYASHNGQTVVFVERFASGDIAITDVPFEYNTLTRGASPLWSESIFQPVAAEFATMMGDLGDAIETLTGPLIGGDYELVLTVTESTMPGTFSGDNFIEIATRSPRSVWQTTGNFLPFAVLDVAGGFPYSDVLTHAGYLTDDDDTGTSNPDGTARVKYRFERHLITFRSFQYAYLVDRLMGVTALVFSDVAIYTRGLWLRATNTAAEGDPETYTSVEIIHQWMVDDSICLDQYGAANVFSGDTAHHNAARPLAVVDTAGAVTIGVSYSEFGTGTGVQGPGFLHPDISATLAYIWQAPNTVLTVYDTADPSTSLTRASGTETITYDIVREGLTEYTNSIANPVSDSVIESGIMGPQSNPGAQVAFAFNFDMALSPPSEYTVIREDQAWGEEVYDWVSVRWSLSNSFAAGYQHRLVTNFDNPDPGFTHTVFVTGMEVHEDPEWVKRLFISNTDDRVWYTQYSADLSYIRKHTITFDPDLLDYVVTFVDIQIPPTLTFDGTDSTSSPVVIPFDAFEEGRLA